jgi:hypothetical protein
VWPVVVDRPDPQVLGARLAMVHGPHRPRLVPMENMDRSLVV